MGIKAVLNYSILPTWNPDIKRQYRQVNVFNIFIGSIALSAISAALILNIKIGLLVQVLASTIYFGGFILVGKHKIAQAKTLAIYTFETHIFLVSFFAVYETGLSFAPVYSPVMVSFIIYPLIAALFDLSIIKHTLIAFIQIFLSQFITLFTGVFTLQKFASSNWVLLHFFVFLYTIILITFFTHRIINENKTVKKLEFKKKNELRKILIKIEKRNSKIEKQKAELNELNITKNKFFSIISHDLKSPFSALIGLAEILVQDSHKNQKENIIEQNIYQTSREIYKLLENLLEWSRTQLDRVMFAPSVIGIHNTISGAIEHLKVNASNKEVKIDINISNESKIYADPELFNIILRNLVSNAIKYSNKGNTVTISKTSKPGKTILKIKDEGTGINKKELKQLFTLENKLSIPGTNNEKGTGLGLIISQEYMKMHQGEIWAESVEGEGTTFFLEFPEM